MHYMDRTYGRGLAAHPMPLTSHDYPPGVKSPLEKLIERERADERAKVVDEILADLKSEIDWQDEHYGAGTDKTGMGRLIGMQDAYATVARHRGAPAESVVGALPTPAETRRTLFARDGQQACDAAHPLGGASCQREVGHDTHLRRVSGGSEGWRALPDQAGSRIATRLSARLDEELEPPIYDEDRKPGGALPDQQEG